MVSELEVVNIPAQPALSVSRRSPAQELSKVFPAAMGKIESFLKEIGEEPAGSPYVIYFNEDLQNLDMEIGFPVRKPLLGLNDIIGTKTIGGNVASCLYEGPYDKIGEAYEKLTEFVKNKGLQTKGISCEMYLNDPAETAPEKLLTRIIFPIDE